MRTLHELPEIETKIIDGTFSPSTVSKAIQFLNEESKIEERIISKDEKRELFHRLIDAFLEKHDPVFKDQRKVKREARQKNPAPVKNCFKDYDVQMLEKIEKRGRAESANNDEIVDQVDDAKLDEIAATAESDATAKSDVTTAATEVADSHSSKLSAHKSIPRREYLTAEVKRKVRLTYDSRHQLVSAHRPANGRWL